MATPKIEDCERIVVVEGYSDLLFLAELLEATNRLSGTFIKELGGKSNFPSGLEALLSPGLLAAKKSIAVIADSDAFPDGTARSLSALLSRLTAQTVSVGSWSDGEPRIGLFVVPSADESGEMETLIWQAWAEEPANRAARSCIEQYVACMAQNGSHPKSPDKALIGALLSIKNDEDPRLGPGSRAGVFNLESPKLRALKQFLALM